MYHIKCRKGEIADKVIVCGDPRRSQLISGSLQECRMVNENRGLLAYTGRYEGTEVSVVTHGMGAPSAAIVVEELAMLGAREIIRVGTTGGIRKGTNIGDLIIPTEAIPLDGASKAYMKAGGRPFPDMGLTGRLFSQAQRTGKRCFLGKICTSDTFYLEEEKDAKAWSERGALGFEMECSVIFVIGSIRNFKAAAILVVSGLIGQGARVLDDSNISESVASAALSALRTLCEDRNR